MEKEISRQEIDLSYYAKMLNQKNNDNSSKEIITQKHIQSQKKKGTRIYASKRSLKKKRMRLVKKSAVLVLLTATVISGVKVVHNVVTEANVVYYKVQPGDSIYEIASKFGVPGEQIVRDNSLVVGPGGLIHPGDVLALETSTKLAKEYGETHDIEENKDEWLGRIK